MTQAADDTIHVQLSVGPEHDFEQNFSLQLQLAGFICINGIRFESDLDGICGWAVLLNFWPAVRKLLLSESAGCDRTATAVAAAVAIAAGRHAIAEAGARHRSLQALRAACAVAFPAALGHVERAGSRGNQACSRLAFTLDSVGITKAAGLHLLHRGIQRRRRRASRRKFTGMNQLRTRATRRHLDLRRSEIVDRDFRCLWLNLGLRLGGADLARYDQVWRCYRNGW